MRTPPLVDIHFHGQGGLDCMSRDPADLLRLSLRLARQGVGAFLPTFISSPRQDIVASLEVIKSVVGSEKGARILGVHLEGPFLHPARIGTHNPVHVRPPDLAEVKAWLAAGEGLVKLVTLAPELPGAARIMRFLVDRGVRVSMGHSAATFKQAGKAKALGATSVTHLFNAMPPLHHREPGLAGFALLDADLYTEVIADGVHVSDEMLRLVFRARPAKKIILVSDGFFLTGAKSRGTASLGGMKVRRFADGSLRKLDGTLAGSNATLPQIVSRAIRVGGLPRAQVLAMASRNPLAMLGLD